LKKRNSVYRLRPKSYWKLAEHEIWFSKMARNGLHIKEVGAYFIKLEKGEPKKTQFKVVLLSDENYTSDENISLYEDDNWSYVCSYKPFGGSISNSFNKFALFSAPEIKNPLPLKLDTGEQIYQLNSLKKHIFSEFIMTLVLNILYFITIFFLLKSYGSIHLFLVDTVFHIYTLILFISAYDCVRSFLGYKYVNKAIENFSEEASVNKYTKYKDKLFPLNSISFPIIILILIYLFSQVITSINHSFKEKAYDLPIVTLYDIEGSKDVKRIDPASSTEKELNHYNYTYNIFATTYNTTESVDKNGIDTYIHTSTYKITFHYLVDSLVTALENNHNFGENTVQVNNSNFDHLSVYEDSSKLYSSPNVNYYNVFASRGKNIIHVTYSGNANLDKILEIISDKFYMLE